MNNSPFGFVAALLPIILLFIVWTFVWKGMALWKAARNSHKGWFIALLLINTLGILEILYIFVFGKTENSAPTTKTQV